MATDRPVRLVIDAVAAARQYHRPSSLFVGAEEQEPWLDAAHVRLMTRVSCFRSNNMNATVQHEVRQLRQCSGSIRIAEAIAQYDCCNNYECSGERRTIGLALVHVLPRSVEKVW